MNKGSELSVRMCIVEGVSVSLHGGQQAWSRVEASCQKRWGERRNEIMGGHTMEGKKGHSKNLGFY